MSLLSCPECTHIVSDKALAVYHFAPYDICSRTLTFEAVYHRFYDEKFKFNKKTLSDSSKYAYETAFKHCTSIHHLHTLHPQTGAESGFFRKAYRSVLNILISPISILRLPPLPTRL